MDKNENSLDSSSSDEEVNPQNYFTAEQITQSDKIEPENTINTNKTILTIPSQFYEEKSYEVITHDNYYKKFMRDPGMEGRKASRILFLRTFNNWVKACIINKYTYLLGSDLSVMDICCGRGGDLEKYFRSKTRVYVGADLSEESLRNALDRIVKLKSEKYRDLNTKCFFITEDVSDPNNNLMKKIPNEIYFDFVSCQFAMHYHFESEIKIRTFLDNVTTKLNDGGYFIGTIIDSNVLVKRLRNRKNSENYYLKDKLTIGNEFYSVKFDQKRFSKEKGPYGIKYGFYLEDSIDKRDELGQIKYIGEYLVLFENFVRLCKEYDLHLVERKNFTEFFEENMDNKIYRNLFRKMIKELNSDTKEQQWEIIHLYQMFAFRKGKDKGKRYYPVYRQNKVHFKDLNPEFIEHQFD
jgi:mRNA (guanine-N7-)-methyltransferase